MNLQQGVLRHSTVTLAGWDLSAGSWVSGVSKGSFKRQDSFIVNRSFGLVKRLFLAAKKYRIDAAYGLVATEDGTAYIVESENHNLQHDRAYSYSYQFRSAPYTAEIYRMVPGPDLPSGMPGNEVEQVLHTTPCDIERFGTLGSTEFDDVRYTQMSVVLPGNLQADTDAMIRILGREYNIREFNPNVRENIAICVQRGTG